MSPVKVPVIEGEAPFHVHTAGKPCKTWYKVLGDLKHSKHRPLIVVHGGPGLQHDYMSPLADLARHFSIPVIFYDQLGGGRSTHLPEKNGDTSFWTEDLFMDELDNLLMHLGIGAFDALGHSWGGMLLARYAATRPSTLTKLIIASAPADMGLWKKNVSVLRKKLPRDVQDVLDKHEAEGTTDSPEYQEAVNKFYSRYICLLDPMPEDLTSSFAKMEEDPTVYHTMYGHHEFDIRGPLKDWSVVLDIPKISVPTFLINGRHDEAQDIVMRPFFRLIGKVKWYTFAESSHLPHFEEREKYMQLVAEFLADE